MKKWIEKAARLLHVDAMKVRQGDVRFAIAANCAFKWFFVKEGEGLPVLVLIDECQSGRRSLTNAMESALMHISREIDIDLSGFHIVYCDSQNQYDRVVANGVDIFPGTMRPLEYVIGFMSLNHGERVTDYRTAAKLVKQKTK